MFVILTKLEELIQKLKKKKNKKTKTEIKRTKKNLQELNGNYGTFPTNLTKTESLIIIKKNVPPRRQSQCFPLPLKQCAHFSLPVLLLWPKYPVWLIFHPWKMLIHTPACSRVEEEEKTLKNLVW